MSRRLAAAGFDLLISARDRARLETLADELSGPTTRQIHIDAGELTGAADVRRVADGCRRFGAPACLVNASGVFGPIAHPESISPREWEAVMALNATAPIALACSLLPDMLNAGFGRIVMVSSAHTLYPADALTSPYFVSKAALNAATRGLAARLQGTDVAAVLMHPGDLKTAMWADIAAQVGRLGEEAAQLREWARSVGESGGDDPADAAELVAEIIDRDGSWSNGRFLFAGASAERHPSP